MDILLAILEAFLGIDLREKKPPPRRRVRPAGETGTARPAPSASAASRRRAEPAAPPAPARRKEAVEPSAEEVWRHFFGIPQEESAPHAVQASAPIAAVPTPTPAAVRPQPPVSPIAPRESTLSPVASLANGLRGNPTAARDAFVYAEIFGPPLADR